MKLGAKRLLAEPGQQLVGCCQQLVQGNFRSLHARVAGSNANAARHVGQGRGLIHAASSAQCPRLALPNSECHASSLARPQPHHTGGHTRSRFARLFLSDVLLVGQAHHLLRSASSLPYVFVSISIEAAGLFNPFLGAILILAVVKHTQQGTSKNQITATQVHHASSHCTQHGHQQATCLQPASVRHEQHAKNHATQLNNQQVTAHASDCTALPCNALAVSKPHHKAHAEHEADAAV